MTTQTSVDKLCKLFIDVLSEGDDVNLATSTVQQTKSLKKTISVLRKEKLNLFKNPSAGSILKMMDTIFDMPDGNIGVLRAIGAEFRSKALGDDIAMAYLDTARLPGESIAGLDRAKWDRELFRLEPAPVLCSLVASRDIPVAPEAKAETERLLRAAVQQKVDLSAQPSRRLLSSH